MDYKQEIMDKYNELADKYMEESMENTATKMAYKMVQDYIVSEIKRLNEIPVKNGDAFYVRQSAINTALDIQDKMKIIMETAMKCVSDKREVKNV